MDPISLFPAIISLFAAFGAASLITRFYETPSLPGRFATLDGLRGYLAFFVFLNHSATWYFYLRSGEWNAPPSKIYTHFGQASVELFFMITGFLFFSKLLDARTKPLDWNKLFISRILRLVPLYFLVAILIFGIVALLSGGIVYEPVGTLLQKAIGWLTFTMYGSPNLNGVENTYTIVAGVTWTLRYEWSFYLSLPLLAILMRINVPLHYLIFCLICLVCLPLQELYYEPAVAFLGGLLAAHLVKYDRFRYFAAKESASVLVLVLVSLTVAIYPTAYTIQPILLLTLAFLIIAGGNSMFGILTNPVSRLIGEMSYSIYMLHGIILFVNFTFVVGVNEAKEFSPMEHWILVIGLSPLVIFTSFLTFRFIERPTMQSTETVIAWFNVVKATLARNSGTGGGLQQS